MKHSGLQARMKKVRETLESLVQYQELNKEFREDYRIMEQKFWRRYSNLVGRYEGRIKSQE